MNQEQALRLSAILLTASAFSGLALTGELPLVLTVIGFSSLILSLLQVRALDAVPGTSPPWFLFQLSRRSWNVLIIVAFGGFLVDLLWISQDLLPAGIHFLILLMVNKLFTLQQRKDFLHLYAISLLELLSAAALTVELWYAAVFVAYLLATIWTLLLYHLRNETEEVLARAASAGEPADPVHRPGPITTRFFWTTNTIAMGAFCLTLAIFFLTPRIGAGFFNKNRGERIRTSGFSEQVDLGVMGAVKLDQTVVMRVEFPDRKGPFPAVERLYFRGAVFDVYNGRSWSKRTAHRYVVGRTSDGSFDVSADRPPESDRPARRQEILIEALDTSVLFGASFVESLKGNFMVLQIDEMGALSLPYTPGTRFQYSAISRPDQILEEERTQPDLQYPDTIQEGYLQVPQMNPQVMALAREVTEQARTPYEQVVAVEAHLRNAYAYSLDVGTTAPANPVEEFLFVRKTGYCEHYATAMVMLLRDLGIPARLVTGFLPGEWNNFGNYYTIRQRDAHAWVEVYFPRSGWVTFDPTPSVAAATADQFWAEAGRVVDSIRLKWDRFIIQYSLRDQLKAAEGIREQSDKVRRETMGLLAVLQQWATALRARFGPTAVSPGLVMLAGLVGGLAVLAALGGWLWGRTKHGRASTGLATARQAAAVRLYGRMLRVMESRGISKAPSATALEFARRIAGEWAAANRFVEPLTELYCRVRFGQAPLSAEDVQRAEELLTGLRTVPR